MLGKFGVIMADPPWEIHQDLPYGTMADEEMRRMGLGALQDEGVIFLWVTGAQAPAGHVGFHVRFCAKWAWARCRMRASSSSGSPVRRRQQDM